MTLKSRRFLLPLLFSIGWLPLHKSSSPCGLFLKKKIKTVIITGGGRKNIFIVDSLKKALQSKKIKVKMIEKLKYNGDFLEAQAFAYLAIRCLHKLPLSLPSTTGVKKQITGGIIYK